MNGIDGGMIQTAKDWDAGNPGMEPIPMPDGYKAVYLYKQPVIYSGIGLTALPKDSEYENRNGWGIISIRSGHEIGSIEKKSRQDMFTKAGMECIGDLRLTKQMFTLALGQK